MIVNIQQPSRFVSFSMPLPKGLYHWAPGTCAVRVFDGAHELPCQNERQERYDDGSCASVFVYADAGPGNAPSQVTVQIDTHSEREYPPFEWHLSVMASLRSWFLSEFACDAEGRLCPPTMNGPVVIERRLRRGGWVRFYNQSPAVLFNCYDHNATVGASDMAPIKLGRTVPIGWMARHVLPEPIQDPYGQLESDIGYWLPQRVLRPSRYIAFPAAELARSNEAHPLFGWGTVKYAWRSTGALAPLFYPLPDLSFETGLSASQSATWSVARDALLNGTHYPPTKKPDGSWNFPASVRHGWLHPGWETEGGGTSGYDITFGGPAREIETGNPDAILLAMAHQFFRLSRDRAFIFDTNNEPATWEKYASAPNWRLSVDDPGKFDKQGAVTLDGPFGYSVAIPAPYDPDLVALKAFECTDWAHLTRSLHYHHVLAVTINDPISRLILRCYGELARMAWHCGGRIGSDQGWASKGLGVDRDRILGWQLYAINLAYAWGGNALRSRFHADQVTAASIFFDATNFSPTICAIRGGKQVTRAPYAGNYAVCVQPTGECQLAVGFGSLPGMARPVFEKAAQSLEWLRNGTHIAWSAAIYDKATQTVFPARDDSLSSVTWTTGQYDEEQALGVLGLAGFQGVDVMPTVHALLGPAPLAKLRSKGERGDSDAPLVSYLQSIGSP